MTAQASLQQIFIHSKFKNHKKCGTLFLLFFCCLCVVCSRCCVALFIRKSVLVTLFASLFLFIFVFFLYWKLWFVSYVFTDEWNGHKTEYAFKREQREKKSERLEWIEGGTMVKNPWFGKIMKIPYLGFGFDTKWLDTPNVSRIIKAFLT